MPQTSVLVRFILAAVTALTAAVATGRADVTQAVPVIELRVPTPGQAIAGPLDVRVRITDFTLDGVKIGTPPAPGVGHWHVYVDGEYAGLSVSEVVTIPNDALPQIAPGQHELKVQLHNHDHSPVAGDISTATTITVTQPLTYAPALGATPSITLVAPAADAQLGTGPHVIKARVGGFKQDGVKIGTPPAPGVGHWHLYIDGAYAGLSVSDSLTLPNDALPQVAPGRHELKVQLHNHDHSLVMPDVTDAISVTFTGTGEAGQAAPPAPLPPAPPGAAPAATAPPAMPPSGAPPPPVSAAPGPALPVVPGRVPRTGAGGTLAGADHPAPWQLVLPLLLVVGTVAVAGFARQRRRQ